jgi:hypothetical protein
VVAKGAAVGSVLEDDGQVAPLARHVDGHSLAVEVLDEELDARRFELIRIEHL